MFLLNQTTHRMVLRHHNLIGHMWIPGLNARIPHEGGGFFIKTNQAGFRSETEFLDKKGDAKRILFFGDSMTAGHGCDNCDRFSDRVGMALGAETYNYGLSGSGTDQQVLILEEYAQDVEADLVILGVYVENIQRNMVQSRPTIDRNTAREVLVPKPYFTLKDEELFLHNTPVSLTRETAPHRPASETQSAPLNLAREVASRLRDNPIATRLLKPLLSPKTSDYTSLRATVSRVAGYDPTPEYTSQDSKPRELLAALIGRFHASCNGKRLVVMPIPTIDHILGKAKATFQEFFADLAAPSKGLHVFDLHGSLQELSFDSRKDMVFDHDAHFSPTGHEFVANALQEYLIKERLISHAAPTTVSPLPQEATYILGFSCFYHNSAACLLRNGEIVAAAEEERFTRIKQDKRFPSAAINYCLEEAGIHQSELDCVVFYDDPHLTLERIIASMAAIGFDAKDQWMRAMPSWVCHKTDIARAVKEHLRYDGPVYNTLHHRSHAASAFYPSPFEQAAIVTVDGVGEWATASIGRGAGNKIDLIKEMHFPHSLGLLYSAFTQFLGFKPNSGEYKMMGLAPYGRPIYKEVILDKFIKLNEDGSLILHLEQFEFLASPAMTGEAFEREFGPAREPESDLTQRDLDLASSIQVVTEDVILHMIRHAHELTGEENLVLSGGVALNCVANGRILREGPFKNIWIQPAAGDSGGALGAALDMWHTKLGKPRYVNKTLQDAQKASLLGPAYSNNEIIGFAESHGAVYHRLPPKERASVVAEHILMGKVVGHFSGRLEYGPRALGARSIIGDPRDREMQSTINLKIKYRESFRPFAPIVLEERLAEYFDLDRPSPYMLIVAPVTGKRRLPFELPEGVNVHEAVKQPRSDIPAITHVDYSARIQSVGEESNQALRMIMKAFEAKTECGVLVNTSFNVRGEPIVNTPYEAYRCFMQTEMDVLIMEDCLFLKDEQPQWERTSAKVAPASSSYSNALFDGLETLFHGEFLPLAAAHPHMSFSREAKTGWLSGTLFPSTRRIARMDEANGAEAIVSRWHDQEFAHHMLPTVRKLSELGRLYPATSELAEEVSDQMYVMF